VCLGLLQGILNTNVMGRAKGWAWLLWSRLLCQRGFIFFSVFFRCTHQHCFPYNFHKLKASFGRQAHHAFQVEVHCNSYIYIMQLGHVGCIDSKINNLPHACISILFEIKSWELQKCKQMKSLRSNGHM